MSFLSSRFSYVDVGGAFFCGAIASATITWCLYQRKQIKESGILCSLERKTEPLLYDNSARLKQILDFMKVTEKLKLVARTVWLSDGARQESSAEHSWHVALFYLLMQHDFPPDLDHSRVVKMLLVHDLVEVIAGDTPLYDTYTKTATGVLVENADAVSQKKQKEKQAAAKLFGSLPHDLHTEMLGLWNEYEARCTMEANIAKSLDKLHPLIQNSVSNGRDYLEFKATYKGELSLLARYQGTHPVIQKLGLMLLDEARQQGWIA